MNKPKKLMLASAVALAASPVSFAGQVLNDDFNSLTMSDSVSLSGSLTCSGSVPSSSMTMTAPTGTGNWSMLVSSSYPRTWMGTTATQSWAISSGEMATHAQSATSDNGLAWISRLSMDRTKYLSALGTLSLDACSVGNGVGCMAGVALINSETNYREISFTSSGFDAQSRLQVEVGRYAPCDYRPFKDASGNVVRLTAAQLKTFRIDYRGADGGGWRYYMDGSPLYLDFGAGLQTLETTSNLSDANLSANPHIGNYWTAPSGGYYVEGHVDRMTTYALAQLTGITATASASYPGNPPSSAVDGNLSTFWSAGAGAPQWIELDLGATHTVRKLRLHVEQNPAGATSHNIYVGNAPAPSTLVGTLSGTTSSGQWLELDLLESNVSGRYVRIYTATSPSWIAWDEIQVFE